MCGISGIFDSRSLSPIDKDQLERMNNIQSHRGPDESGIFIDPGIGLAHRRLSIIDLSNGKQPLFNEDNSVVVVYNGEIYNFQQLAKELRESGHIFRTHCDTEVIVHAWEEWGKECVHRFRGMFAFALWDKNKQELFLARDRLGIKPLYYALLPSGHLLFSSELKSLLVHRDLRKEIDPLAVEEYFAFGYVPDPRTILQNVYKLPPGHTISIRRGQALPGTRRYWDIPFKRIEFKGESDIEEQLLSHLREAVDIRLVSEVPLGAFLSGGVDSSAVVAMMADIMSDPVNTCSISFGDPCYNESQYAAEVANRYKTNHFVEQVEADDFDLIDKLATVYDEPFADSSAIPTYRVCELARKRVIVTLSGDGGDENFAGYRRYRWHMYEEKVRSILPQYLRGPLFGMLGTVYPKLDWAPKVLRAKSTFQALARDTLEGFLHSVSVVPNHQRGRMFSSSFTKKLQGYRAIEVFRNHEAEAPTDDALSLVQYIDLKTYLPGDILTKVDRASMAHSLEVRVPILDHKFVEWCSGVAPAMKLNGREGKYIFKKSLKSVLDDNILYRQKMGFAVPISSWIRGPLRERVRNAVLGPVLEETGIFDMGYLKQMVDQHQSGLGEHSAAIWATLMFESFLRNSLNTYS